MQRLVIRHASPRERGLPLESALTRADLAQNWITAMENRESDRRGGPGLLSFRTVLTAIFAAGACIGLSYVAHRLTDASTAQLFRYLAELAGP